MRFYNGDVIIAKSFTSSCEDIFGPTVNLCSKINHYARQNELVIGNDLRQIMNGVKNYQIESIAGYPSGLKVQYPIYSVKMKN
jgi:class 3 adenylate cyclase